MDARLRVLPELLGVLLVGVGLYAAMVALAPALADQDVLPDYDQWLHAAPESPGYLIYWFLADITRMQFYGSAIGGLGLVGCAYLAYVLDRRGSRWRGFRIAHGTGLWPWILLSTSVALAISVLVFVPTGLGGGEWLPTFVPFVSVPAGVVLIYGPGWQKALTGAVLGVLVTVPAAHVMIHYILDPLGLPHVIGNVTSIWVGGVIAFEICRHLPWMRSAVTSEQAPGPAVPPRPGQLRGHRTGRSWGHSPPRAAPEPGPARAPQNGGRWWVPRRVLADFSEMQLYGNEIASAGLILGTLLSWVLNPQHPAMGTGLLPAILLSQIITASLGVFLYLRQWQERGWYPTFVPVVSVAPATVLTFGGSLQSIVAGAVLGAVLGPPVAQFVNDRLPDHWHMYIANAFSMGLCTLAVVPTLALLPGFDMT